MIELSKIATTKGKARKQDLYKWAKLISASTWEEIREESGRKSLHGKGEG